MKNKISLLFTVALGAAAVMLLGAGCMTTKTTTTLTKQPDGSYQTNVVKTVKGQDPFMNKVIQGKLEEKGIFFKTMTSPAGTSSGLSPIELCFGWSKLTYTAFPVYPGVTNGYTPPLSFVTSSAGSLWNDSDNGAIATAPGLNPTNAYYQSAVQTVNPLVQTTGTVTAATAAASTVSTVSTNAASK